MSEPDKFVDAALIDQIEAYITAHNLTVTEFGLRSVNDRRLIPDLREGRELRRTTRERILSFLSSPPDAPDQRAAS